VTVWTVGVIFITVVSIAVIVWAVCVVSVAIVSIGAIGTIAVVSVAIMNWASLMAGIIMVAWWCGVVVSPIVIAIVMDVSVGWCRAVVVDTYLY